MSKNKIPIFYLFIYRNIKEKTNGHRFIDHCKLLEVIGRRLHKLPKTFHYLILKELEEDYHLIKKLDKKKYEITGGDKDKYLNQFYLPI